MLQGEDRTRGHQIQTESVVPEPRYERVTDLCDRYRLRPPAVPSPARGESRTWPALCRPHSAGWGDGTHSTVNSLGAESVTGTETTQRSK